MARQFGAKDLATSVRGQAKQLRTRDPAKQQAVEDEIEALASAEITDVVRWDEFGTVTFTAALDLSPRARKAIKKFKVTPTEHGNQIEVEMHDKVGSLRLLSRVRGMLQQDGFEDERPGLIGINVRGPKGTTTYEVKDDSQKEKEHADANGPGSTADGDGGTAPIAAGNGETV
jgi:hypothetical protein